MKLFYTVLFAFILAQSIFAVDYSKVDKQSAKVPTNLKTAAEIAHYLTKDLSLPTEKARAIYYWIANSITYDFSLMKTNRDIVSKDELVKEILENRKGVCANYAELFNDCCHAVGVESFVITGFTKSDAKVADISHAWNAVFIDGKYSLVDVTWASGSYDNGNFVKEFIDAYFLIEPELFVRSHMPFDHIWQFLDNPLNNFEFENSDFAKLQSKGSFNFSDSIKVHCNLDEHARLIRENRRIVSQGLSNHMVRNLVATNQHNIKVQTYNNNLITINSAVKTYNEYIVAKNKQFNGLTMKDTELLELLATSRQTIELAEQSLLLLNTDDTDLHKQINSTLNSIQELKMNLTNEDVFLSKYIKTLKPFRIFLFVKLNA